MMSSVNCLTFQSSGNEYFVIENAECLPLKVLWVLCSTISISFLSPCLVFKRRSIPFTVKDNFYIFAKLSFVLVSILHHELTGNDSVDPFLQDEIVHYLSTISFQLNLYWSRINVPCN
jgi:hypothetical protein